MGLLGGVGGEVQTVHKVVLLEIDQTATAVKVPRRRYLTTVVLIRPRLLAAMI